MNAVVPPAWVSAAVAFGITLLFFVTLACVYELVSIALRRRRVNYQLGRLSKRATSGTPAPVRRLLRREAGKLPGWTAPIAAKIPHLGDLSHFLEQSGASVSAGAFILLSSGSSTGFALGAMSFGLDSRMIGAVAAWGLLVPYLYTRRKRRLRLKKFEEHFPEAIDLLGRSIRAGHALSTGLSMVAEEAEEPVASEFRQVFEEQKFGLPMGESLKGLTDRIQLPDTRIFSTALMVQRDVGGNLAEILDNLSDVIRERFKFRRQLRTHTAQGRMTAWILGIAPLVAGAGMFMLNPDYMRPLLHEPLGRIMLMSALGLQVFGYLVIRRITEVEF